MSASASLYARLRQTLIGWVYPPTCAICDRLLRVARQIEQPFLCEDCEATLVPIGEHYCRVCGQGFDGIAPRTFRCANCGDRELAIDFAVSAYRGAGVGSHLIHHFKYGKERHLARLFGVLLERVWSDERLLQAASWWVVPVPLHPRRERTRGFNQADELARAFIATAPSGIHLTYRRLLRRIRETPQQASLDREERLINLQSVFVLDPRRLEPLPPGTNILLIDDVITTGTTVSECAAILREAYEVERIAAISVLRG